MMARAALAIVATVPNGVLADKACDKAYAGFRDFNIAEQVIEEIHGKSFDEMVAEPGGFFRVLVAAYVGNATVAERDMRAQQDVQPHTYRLLSMTHELIVCGRAVPSNDEQLQLARELEELYPRRVMEMLLGYATANHSEEVAQ